MVPANVEAAYSLVNLYRATGNSHALLQAHERLARLEPDRHELLLPLAMAQFAASRPEQAEISLRSLLAAQPDNLDATIHLGRHLSRSRLHAEALEIWRKLLKSEPESFEFNLQIARILDQLGNLAEAEPHLLTALKRDPNHVEALQMIGRACLASRRWPTALDIYEHLQKVQPDTPDGILGLFRSHLNLGRLDKARELADRHASNGVDVRALVELLQAEVSSPHGSARDVAAKISALNPDPERLARLLLDNDVSPAHLFKKFKTWTDYAQFLGDEGRWRLVLPLLIHAAQKGEPAAAAANLRGKALVNLKMWDEAEVYWRQYRGLNQKDPEALKQLVTIAREKGDLSAAVKLSHEWARLDIESPEAALTWARLLSRTGKNGDAIAAWKQAFRLDPKSVDILMGLANASFNENELAAAEVAAKQVLMLRPHNAEAIRLIAIVAGRNGNFAEAMNMWRQAAAITPNLAEPPLQLGRIHRQAGRLREAIKAYEKVLSIQPQHVEAFSALGRMYRETAGSMDKAEAIWRKWHKVDPNAIEPMIFLARLSRDRNEVPAALTFYRLILEIDRGHASASDEMSSLLIKGR